MGKDSSAAVRLATRRRAVQSNTCGPSRQANRPCYALWLSLCHQLPVTAPITATTLPQCRPICHRGHVCATYA